MRGLGCCVARPLAAGRHRWAALVAREMVGLSGVSRLVGWRGGTGWKRYGSPHRCMAGGARAASVGLRRRSPPPSTMTERTIPTRSGATVGEPRPSARNKKAFPGGEGVTAVPGRIGGASQVPRRASPIARRDPRKRGAPFARRALRLIHRLAPRVFSMAEGAQLNRVPGVGTAHRETPASLSTLSKCPPSCVQESIAQRRTYPAERR